MAGTAPERATTAAWRPSCVAMSMRKANTCDWTSAGAVRMEREGSLRSQGCAHGDGRELQNQEGDCRSATP